MRNKESLTAKPSILPDPILHIPLKNQLHNYLQHYPMEKVQLEPLLGQLREGEELFDRKTLPGHITASGIVVENGKILLIQHPTLQMWIQPGGHVELGETPLLAAQREISEETGYPTKIHPWHQEHVMPFDIDIHFIPANPDRQETSHLHYDLRFLFQVDYSVDLDRKREPEHLVAWIELSDLKDQEWRFLEKLQTAAEYFR